MSHDKSDFLRECISDPALVGSEKIPMDKFTAAFCIGRCMNRSCVRCGLNNSTFDRRVRNWESMLFTNVPRASEDDPKYSNIRAKRFLPTNPVVEVGSAVPTQATAPTFRYAIDPGIPKVDDVVIGHTLDNSSSTDCGRSVDDELSTNRPQTIEKDNTEQSEVDSGQEVAPMKIPISNTPFNQGAILPGGPPKVEKPNTSTKEPGSVFIFDDE